jgi:hypothetical protein
VPNKPTNGCCRADGGKESKTVLGPALHVVDRALIDIEIQVLRSTLPSKSGVLGRRLEPGLGDESIGTALLQFFRALTHRRRVPEGLVRVSRLRAHPELLVDLGDDDVPAAHRHDGQDRQRHLGDDVAALPKRFQAIRVVDDFRRARSCGRRRRRGRPAPARLPRVPASQRGLQARQVAPAR